MLHAIIGGSAVVIGGGLLFQAYDGLRRGELRAIGPAAVRTHARIARVEHPALFAVFILLYALIGIAFIALPFVAYS